MIFLGMSDDPYKLQCILNLASHYGQMYQVKYGADKTKVTISGPQIDQQYYMDTKPWVMDGKQVSVVMNNEHLGQIVSGTSQLQKNVDNRISKGRNALFSLLGSSFAFKCKLSPEVKLHLMKTFINPVLRSGLSTFSLRSNNINPIAVFHRKTIKSILQLSISAPTPSIHFLTSELPIEAQIHQDVFSLFYCVWNNPQTKIHKIVKYLLENSNEKSRAWTIHVRNLSRMYNMEDPLTLLLRDPPRKSEFKEYITTKIVCYHENELRKYASESESMKYLNTSLFSLRGKPHPAISNVLTCKEIKNMRPHLKLLTGDYLTYEKKARQSGGDPKCRMCFKGISESVSHMIESCEALQLTRQKVFNDIFTFCKQNYIPIEIYLDNSEQFTQFILDPSSINLPIRVNTNDPILPDLFRLCRNFCNAIHTERIRKLKKLSEKLG